MRRVNRASSEKTNIDYWYFIPNIKKIFTLFLIELYIYLKYSSCLILNKIQFWGSVHQKEKKGTFIG